MGAKRRFGTDYLLKALQLMRFCLFHRESIAPQCRYSIVPKCRVAGRVNLTRKNQAPLLDRATFDMSCEPVE
ncbi:MAG: hypothetical protein QOJ15_5530 [Bradyrhizobium sp.]|nr:hypothetical protein [Bradyrhizobium sp.]